MSKSRLIGVDVGTQGTKAALFDADGQRLAEQFAPSRLITPREGEVQQDVNEIFQSVLHTIRGLLDESGQDPRQVVGIGVDAQMAGLVGVDRDFCALTNYDSWLDTRCGKVIPQMKRYEDEIISKTGGPVTYAHGPKMLWWKQECPEVYRDIVKFMPLSSYLSARLCGLRVEDAFVDTTHLHFTAFADNAGKQWDKDLLAAFQVEENILPYIIEPHRVIGGLTAQAAESCGLFPGTPVVAGCGDTAASSLGAGVAHAGQAYDVAGTASVFACATDRFTPDTQRKTLMCARSAIEGLYLPMAYIGGGGLCLKWFADTHRRTLRELDMLAEEVAPGSGGLFFLPHFSGRTCPSNDQVRGGWLGITFAHTEGAMYRSVLESIAYEYHSYLQALIGAGGDLPKVILGTGGGAKSRLFCQIKSDVLGVPYQPLQQEDTATFGAAMLAGFGVGVLENLQQAVDSSGKTRKPVMPRSKETKFYRSLAERYLYTLNAVGAL